MRHSVGIQVRHLGTVPYRDALAIQADLKARRQAEEIPDTLLLLEHPPVYTRGRRSTVTGTADRPTLASELPLGEDFYRAKGIEIVPTDRGGRVTYHGPGQLVGYPIMRVDDVGVHLRRMEAAIVAALAEHGIEARSRCEEGIDYTGVWVADRKIASIGVHISRSVSTHGFAVNVVNDLVPFEWIVPCGLAGVAMTSVEQELGQAPDGGLDAFAELTARRFCAVHGRSPEPVDVAVEDRMASTRDRTSRAPERGSRDHPRGCGPKRHPQTSPRPTAAQGRTTA